MEENMNADFEENQKQDRERYSFNDQILQEFREIVLNQKELKCRTDDIFLLGFLRAKKYNQENALKLLKNYCLIRKKYKEVYQNLRPSVIEKYLQMNPVSIYRIESDKVIGIGKAGDWDTSKANLIDILRCALIELDLELNDHPLQVNGLFGIYDVSLLSWSHILQFSPKIIFVLVSCLFQCIPVRYKAIHFINANKYFKVFSSILFPFLPRKIKKRIHIHGPDIEDLRKIDPCYLPEEYGGRLPPFDLEKYIQKLKEHEHLFIENEKYWTEEDNN